MGPELVSETEDKVRLIRDHLKAVSDRQKCYSDLKRRDIEFSVGDQVFLELEVPLKLDSIHNVFHISLLRRYRSNPSHLLSIEEIEVRPYLTFEEKLVQILDREVKVLRRKTIPLVKVLWRNYGIEEATWEPKDSIRQQYLHLFEPGKILRLKFLLKRKVVMP
ncbi:uncharacterized protein LOC108455069 [Gossypium arboreum]|uniref:uncharacterized protein LOC108455069 n=1 Tax=Gossypium arboreum TaxID=29729 RepID=UPI000819683A|nr:uncharacterized protein LOC108455069 [Gossypium arboreum]